MIAKSYARIHWQNLANFGVLAAEFADPAPPLTPAGRHGPGWRPDPLVRKRA